MLLTSTTARLKIAGMMKTKQQHSLLDTSVRTQKKCHKEETVSLTLTLATLAASHVGYGRG